MGDASLCNLFLPFRTTYSSLTSGVPSSVFRFLRVAEKKQSLLSLRHRWHGGSCGESKICQCLERGVSYVSACDLPTLPRLHFTLRRPGAQRSAGLDYRIDFLYHIAQRAGRRSYGKEYRLDRHAYAVVLWSD